MKRTILLIMLFTVFSKVLGFLKDIILSYYFGASSITDAYLVAMTIPVTILALVGAAVTTGYIPIYNTIATNHGEKETLNFTNNLINILSLITTIFVVLGIIFTKPIVLIFASGFDMHTLDLAVKFTRISMLSMYFPVILYILKGYLQNNGEFNAPSLVGLPFNTIIIVSILLGYYVDIIFIIVGTVIAIISQIIYLIPSLRKKKYNYYWKLDFKDKYLIGMVKNAIPVFMGISVNQLNVIIDRSLASRITTGGISALEYSNKLILFVQGIFVLSIISAIFPATSKLYVNNEMIKFKKMVVDSINLITVLLLPITVLFMAFSTEIIRTLFGRGAFDSEAIWLTSSTLYFYSIGLIGFGLREVITRAFYSMQNTKIPLRNAVLGVCLNIILNIILSKHYGIGGLALATSLSAIFTTLLLYISLHKQIGTLDTKRILISFLKISVSVIFMGYLSKILYKQFANIFSPTIALFSAILLGLLIYVFIIVLLKVDSVNVLNRKLKIKFIRRK